MEKASRLREFVKDLLSSQRLAVLATQSQRQPYGSLVAFMGTGRLETPGFRYDPCHSEYANISKNPRVAMIIDNRSNREADFHQAAAVTATGIVKEVEGSEKKPLLKLYLSDIPI